MTKKIWLLLIIAIILLIGLLILIFLPTTLNIQDVFPLDQAKNTTIDTSVRVIFNRAVKASDFQITIGPPVGGKISSTVEDNQLIFRFENKLKAKTTYQVSVSSKKTIIDLQNQKTKKISWKFTTGTKLAEEDEESLTEFFQEHPLVKHLPFSSAEFKIELPDENDVYEITIFGELNRPEQYPTYLEQLKTNKQLALNWIKEKGVDPNSLKIHWQPEEAEKL